MNAADSSSHSTQLRTIVTLFIVLRLTILFLYTPQGLLNAYTDYHHYFRIAQLSDQGYYPFVNMWYEYPPVLAYTAQLAYTLGKSIVPMGGLDTQSVGYMLYARILGSILLIFETGALILMHRIAGKGWGVEKADQVAWVYSALSVPLFYWNASQTSNVLFFTLLALHWFVDGRTARSALALGLGIATKFTPVFLIAPAVRFLLPRARAAIQYAVISLLVVVLTFAPFVPLGGTPWIAASFASMLARPSWATPWALIDGNWGVGDVGDVPTRLQLDQATVVRGNPPAIPSILVLAVFAAGYFVLFRRSIDPREPRHFIWFTTLTAMIFHLWSKGWSPQWVTLIFPLILLSFPDRRGVGLSLWLTASILVEWPLADALHSRVFLLIAIVSRTLVFIAVAVLAARMLWRPARAEAVRAPSTGDLVP